MGEGEKNIHPCLPEPNPPSLKIVRDFYASRCKLCIRNLAMSECGMWAFLDSRKLLIGIGQLYFYRA